MSVAELKRLNTDNRDLDELVGLSAFGRHLQAEFAQLNVEEPDWLGPILIDLRREVATRNRNALDLRIRQLKARQQALKPAAERRAEVDAQIAALEAAKSQV
jgi:hypothetical protein